jgi:hypothetical protein
VSAACFYVLVNPLGDSCVMHQEAWWSRLVGGLCSSCVSITWPLGVPVVMHIGTIGAAGSLCQGMCGFLFLLKFLNW